MPVNRRTRIGGDFYPCFLKTQSLYTIFTNPHSFEIPKIKLTSDELNTLKQSVGIQENIRIIFVQLKDKL